MKLVHRGVAVVAAATMAFASLPVNAATVSNKAGTVLISKGEGFVPLTGSMEVAPGGRVLVKADGLATITYASGCTVRVGSGFWQVQGAAPCAKDVTELDFSQRMSDGVLNKPGPPPPPAGYMHHDLVVGGVIVGGVVLSCVLWWCRDDDDRPASP